MANRRILLIDDCIDTLDLVKAALEGDFEVYGIQDSRQAETAIEISEPDAVILDLMMPHRSGFEILDDLKGGRDGKKPTPVIVLSCKKSREDQVNAYEKGARLFLSKPFEPDRLLRMVTMFFEGETKPPTPKSHSIRDIERMMNLRAQFTMTGLPKPDFGAESGRMSSRGGTKGAKKSAAAKDAPAEPNRED